MKNITNTQIEKDYQVILEMLNRYKEAIWEGQMGQAAHYDNQPKIVQIAMTDVRTGLRIALEALEQLKFGKVKED